VNRSFFEVGVQGGALVGWRTGSGPPVLLLHGGPAGYEYLDFLADELGSGYEIAAYQQRGMSPSTEAGPFDIATEAADFASVLDALGWGAAYVVGHSLGGYYALQVARRLPDRVRGALIVDPLGAVGDGGVAEFLDTQLSRLTPEQRHRADELEAREGPITPDESIELTRLIWPTYFAQVDHTFDFLLRTNDETHQAIHKEVFSDMPALAEALPSCLVRIRFVHGSASPMPVSASADTASLLPNAELEVIDGAGHFVWFERPGSVRDALARLLAET
jgi:proline iminopeptidase